MDNKISLSDKGGINKIDNNHSESLTNSYTVHFKVDNKGILNKDPVFSQNKIGIHDDVDTATNKLRIENRITSTHHLKPDIYKKNSYFQNPQQRHRCFDDIQNENLTSDLKEHLNSHPLDIIDKTIANGPSKTGERFKPLTDQRADIDFSDENLLCAALSKNITGKYALKVTLQQRNHKEEQNSYGNQIYKPDQFCELRKEEPESRSPSPPERNSTSDADDSYDLGVGSVVEVKVNQEPRYGVIRWIGVIPEDHKRRKIAGIEMEEEHNGYSDGTFNGKRYFNCKPNKAIFVSLSRCQKDARFQDDIPQINLPETNQAFGLVDCPAISGIVQPVGWKGDLDVCGKFKGIQGHHNSCYLDATLFSMFTFTCVFDSLLYRPPTENDIVHYEEVQRVLREEIVNPLRQNLFVRADRVMKLRTLLENLSSVTGLTSEEKDPEEFLTSLVAQILRAEPFLKLSSGQEAYHYQLFVEKDEDLVLPSVQQLFEQSFLTSNIKLKEVPSCLIIQMPRFGKSYKMYPRILPSQLLDVTDVIEDSPRQCIVCGKLAEYECRECFGQCGSGLESTAFCSSCLETAHNHQKRSSHAWKKLSVPVEFSILQDHCHVPRMYMELFAVVCIETSHYVSFVKCGSESDAPWCFFDSMADRKGEQNGYNIPEVVLCPKLPYWLSDEGAHSLQEIKDDRLLPEHAKRLLCDAYMCMYQSRDVMMYR